MPRKEKNQAVSTATAGAELVKAIAATTEDTEEAISAATILPKTQEEIAEDIFLQIAKSDKDKLSLSNSFFEARKAQEELDTLNLAVALGGEPYQTKEMKDNGIPHCSHEEYAIRRAAYWTSRIQICKDVEIAKAARRNKKIVKLSKERDSKLAKLTEAGIDITALS